MSDPRSQVKPEKTQATIIEALNMALADAMEEDSKVLVLGEDVADPEEGGITGGTKGLSTRFGEHRVRSTPISEQAIMGAAIGASLAGYKPVAEIMLMNFTTVAMDMIYNHAAKLRYMSGGQTHVPIVIRTMTGAGFSTAGQHSDFLEAWFANSAGLKVVAPSTAADAYGLMRSAIDDPDPVLIIENMPIYWLATERPQKGPCSDRQGTHRRRRQRSDDRHLFGHGPQMSRSPGASESCRHQRRDRRFAQHLALGREHGLCVRPENGTLPHRT